MCQFVSKRYRISFPNEDSCWIFSRKTEEVAAIAGVDPRIKEWRLVILLHSRCSDLLELFYIIHTLNRSLKHRDAIERMRTHNPSLVDLTRTSCVG